MMPSSLARYMQRPSPMPILPGEWFHSARFYSASGSILPACSDQSPLHLRFCSVMTADAIRRTRPLRDDDPTCSEYVGVAGLGQSAIRGKQSGRTNPRLRCAPSGLQCLMLRSIDRFLTTHTGSLPRPDDLIRMMFAREEGVPVDPAALAARVRTAVAAVVEQQIASGIDLLNDGEMSKPSYATYVKDRLAGFGGTGNTFVYQDLADFPNLARRVFGDPGRSRRKTPACNAPIEVRDIEAASIDVANLKVALASAGHRGAFMSAASPGVVS